MYIKKRKLAAFQKSLIIEEKAKNTQEKYMRDIKTFMKYLGHRTVRKTDVISFKQALIEKGYKTASINSMIVAINRFVTFCGHPEYGVRLEKVQRRIYRDEEHDLTKKDYEKLRGAAGKDERLGLILEVFASTGIRVSELSRFTVEAVSTGEVEIKNKGKIRTILVPSRLRDKLLKYCKDNKKEHGVIFCSRNGRALDRSYIWASLKVIGKEAGIDCRKAYPHNLRRLFAKCFYNISKDIAKLADVLGHSSIMTTRLYIMETAREHRKLINMLKMVS